MPKKRVLLTVLAVILLISPFFVKDVKTATKEPWPPLNKTEIESILGRAGSAFEEYDVYHDKGISIKYSEVPIVSGEFKGCYYNRTGFAENIVLNTKYKDEVLPKITCGTSKKVIQSSLGSPDFCDDELEVFGYKMEDMYIFFQGTDAAEQISIYPRNLDYDTSIVEKALKLCNDKRSTELAKKIAETFEQAWPDYNYSYSVMGNARYSPRRNSLGIAYFDRGVEVYYSPANNDEAILNIYSNYSGERPKDVVDLFGGKLVAYHKDTDLIFEQEKTRIRNENTLKERIKTCGKISPDGSMILVDNLSYTGIDVISVDGRFANYTIETSPMQYGAGEWLDNRSFVYRYGKGELRVYKTIKKASEPLGDGDVNSMAQ